MKASKPTQYPAGIYHVTWVTHNSRISQRMIDHHVKAGSAIRLDDKTEIKITEIIGGIIREENYIVHAYNICRDHIHMLIKCDENTVSRTVGRIKGKSAKLYKEHLGKTTDESIHLWAQKFNKWMVQSDEQLRMTVEYIFHNRKKHGLPENKGLNPLVQKFVTIFP